MLIDQPPVTESVYQLSYAAPRKGPHITRLANGQLYMWNVLKGLAGNDQHLNLLIEVDAPSGTAFSSLLRTLAGFIEAHESLRTSYPVDASGCPQQLLSEKGEIAVRILRTNWNDFSRVRSLLLAELYPNTFDLSVGPLVRVAIITDGDTTHHMMVMLSHMTADAVGLSLLRSDLKARLSSPVPALVMAAQPQDLAEWEQSEMGIAAEEISAEFWRSQLAQSSTIRFRCPPEPAATPRWWTGILNSDVVATCTRTIAARCGVSPASVIVGFFLVHLTERVSGDRIAFMLKVANRLRPKYQHAITQLAQDVPMSLAINESPSMRQLLVTTWKRMLHAQTAGQMSQGKAARLIEAAAAHGDAPTRFDVFVNIIPEMAGPSTLAQHAAQGSPKNVFFWGPKYAVEQRKAMLIASLPGRLLFMGDTTVYPRDQIEALLTSMEYALGRAVDCPELLERSPPEFLPAVQSGN